MHKLDALRPSAKPQRTALCTWLAEIMLQQLCKPTAVTNIGMKQLELSPRGNAPPSGEVEWTVSQEELPEQVRVRVNARGAYREDRIPIGSPIDTERVHQRHTMSNIGSRIK